jgi:hypothetical protein
MGRTNPKIPYIWLRKKDMGREKQNNNEGLLWPLKTCAYKIQLWILLLRQYIHQYKPLVIKSAELE